MNVTGSAFGRSARRRDLLKGAAAVAVGITTLAGCASPPSASIVPTAIPSVAGAEAAATPAPTAVAKAKYGGAARFNVINDAPHLDVHQTSSTALLSWGPAM